MQNQAERQNKTFKYDDRFYLFVEPSKYVKSHVLCTITDTHLNQRTWYSASSVQEAEAGLPDMVHRITNGDSAGSAAR